MYQFKCLEKYGRSINEVNKELYGTVKNKKHKKRHKSKRNFTLKGMTYKYYINSSYWGERRSAYFLKHKKECFVCGSKYSITLHHRVYSSFGYESDKHLIPLCWKCHKKVHEMIINDPTIKLKNAHLIFKQLFYLT